MTFSASGSCHLPPAGFRGVYRSDPLARAVYSEAAGIGRIVPSAVAVPVDADDVVTLVRWASERSISLVPRGSGSSMAGGAIGPGVIVDLSRIDSIGELEPDTPWLWAGAGALCASVNRAAAAGGLRFPVDPSSAKFCTIGGMISTNAAGPHTLRFGATRSWVLALDCVFEDGSRATITRGEPLPSGIPALERFLAEARPRLLSPGARDSAIHHRVHKESSGYAIHDYAESGELVELLVGSEGTLAIVVGAKLALTEIPVATSGVLAAFVSLDDAVKAAAAARAAGVAACELLDRTFLEFAASGETESTLAALAALPATTEAVLLIEIEADTAKAAERGAEELGRKFEKDGALTARAAIAPAEQLEIWELRHAASPILSRLDPDLKSMQFIEDGAVPPGSLAKYIRGVRTALAARDVRGVIFGHAGDAHVHVNPLIDVSRPSWRADVEGLLDDIVELTTRLGGTLAGEHGDGRLRTPLLSTVWSDEARELFSLVKSAFDPRGILNPGVKVPLAGQRPLADIKYDPALPPLPAEARAALDRVTDERAYATSRLSLIPARD